MYSCRCQGCPRSRRARDGDCREEKGEAERSGLDSWGRRTRGGAWSRREGGMSKRSARSWQIERGPRRRACRISHQAHVKARLIRASDAQKRTSLPAPALRKHKQPDIEQQEMTPRPNRTGRARPAAAQSGRPNVHHTRYTEACRISKSNSVTAKGCIALRVRSIQPSNI